jgi:hypothetical protein
MLGPLSLNTTLLIAHLHQAHTTPHHTTPHRSVSTPDSQIADRVGA